MSQAEEKVVPVQSPVKPAVMAVAVLGFIALAVYLVYLWGFCRFYVPAGHMAVVTAKSGKAPAPGTILVAAKRASGAKCCRRGGISSIRSSTM